MQGSLHSLSADEITELRATLSTEEKANLLYRWDLWRRPKQAPPPEPWSGWIIDAGRGWGKTRTGAEQIRHWVEVEGVKRIGISSETAADNRKIIAEGESGLLAISPPWNMPVYEPSKTQITWPNGAVAYLYDAREPGQLRGPQHEKFWFDELAKYRYAEQCFDMAMFGLRLGANPQWMATTTPQPTPFFKQLLKDPTVFITKGRTVENLLNLSAQFKKQVVDRYAGTTLGRQELDAELLDDIKNALWSLRLIEEGRVYQTPPMQTVVVAFDPATTSRKMSNEHGIITCGLGAKDQRGYVIDDVSGILTPDQAARRAVGSYERHKADAIVVETNNGGDWIPALIATINPNVNVIPVTASRGKVVRAQPVSALYEQGKISHIGLFADLENQMRMFTPELAAFRPEDSSSPDRVDALVWGFSYLFPDLTENMSKPLTYGAERGGGGGNKWMGG